MDCCVSVLKLLMLVRNNYKRIKNVWNLVIVLNRSISAYRGQLQQLFQFLSCFTISGEINYTVKNLFHFIYILEWSFSLLSRVCLLISHLSKSMVHSPSLNWKEILNCRCNLENFQLINNFCLSSIISQGKFKKSPWLSG